MFQLVELLWGQTPGQDCKTSSRGIGRVAKKCVTFSRLACRQVEKLKV